MAIIKEIKTCNAKNIYFSTQESSWASFTFSDSGDLNILSDWGFYSFAWRSYSTDFESFLRTCDSEYVFQKLMSNCQQWSVKPSKLQKQHLLNNIKTFIQILKSNNKDDKK
jgi:hypothetical protein